MDVVIVGAGAAGLMAAAVLTRSKKRVLVLEARERLGGRIFTIGQLNGVPIELGAEFVHELTAEVETALAFGGSSVIEGEGTHLYLRNGKLRETDDFWKHITDTLDKLPVPRDPARDKSIRELLGRRKNSANDRMLVKFIEGFNAASQDEISARSLLLSHHETKKAGGYKSGRPLGGYRCLIDGLLAQADRKYLKIRLNAPVEQIRWKPGSVNVEYRHAGWPSTIRAKAVLVTVPPQLIASTRKPGSISFSPSVPKKEAAAQAIGVGTVLKVTMSLRGTTRDRKRRKELSEAQFVHLDRVKNFPTWWTSYPYHSPVVTGWTGGPAACELARLSPKEIRREALIALRAFLNCSADRAEKEVENFWSYSWQNDPYSRGAYSFVKTGCQDAVTELLKPVKRTVFFAGEALIEDDLGGTVGSALESGKKAATSLLRSFHK